MESCAFEPSPQDDAHIFCTEGPGHVGEHRVLRPVCGRSTPTSGSGISTSSFRTGPEVRAGSDETWDRAEEALRVACDAAGLDTSLNPGEGAFYGPQARIRAAGTPSVATGSAGTLQVDFVLPERLDALYVAADGSRQRPVMLHRAILGSIERWLGILIEQYAGRFPLWLAPVQVVVATVTDAATDYAASVAARCRDAGLRVGTDTRNEKIGYKVREHSAAKIPVMLVVGAREAEQETVAVRRLGGKAQETLALSEAIHALCTEAAAPE